MMNNLHREPLAIVGIGCRLPGGANSPDAYWRVLSQGVDAISETPPERWNLQKFYSADKSLPSKTQSKWGGYVDGLEQFDPQFFGISPREANSMDPQQRLLLEASYRAIEDAGALPSNLQGRDVAVYVGISSFDYAVAGLSYQDRGVIDAYSNTGGSSSIAANRISYCFDFRGPSVAVDTACSSSLVAVHMACESIWQGDATMALAGGVNALILPDFYVAFSQLGVLSPDGRCKTFDSRANGYVRSEGAGAILLKPLSLALRDQDFIYATIRATALNQDGRTPGMTVPSGEAQQALIQTACEKASVNPRDISYVEAHGTGTPVGDPIEASAIGNAIGQDRESGTPCWVGSVKTNIGHLEAGAGIASIIKVALSMQHQQIPAHLNFESPNPEIDFDALGLRLPHETTPWEVDGKRIAGINGFGYGGANAHVILEEAPANYRMALDSTPVKVSTAASETPDAPVLLPVSGRSKAALIQVVSELADWIDQSGENFHLAEIAGFLAHRRPHFEFRTTVCGQNHAEVLDELRGLAASTPNELAEQLGESDGQLRQQQSKLAFVCSGQGPQWWAMGRGLLKHSPAFRSVIRRCDQEFAKVANWSLLEELQRDEESSRMQKTSIAQPSIFAIQIALAALWKSWGIDAEAIVGHSVGEISAAYLSGALTFEDACSVAFHRGRTMDLATSQGAMVAAGISATEAEARIAGLEHLVSLAAINGPNSVTISGDQETIDAILSQLETEGIFCRKLAVEYAFHSPQMEPVRNELLRALAHIKPRSTTTKMISTVTGEVVRGEELNAEYWWQNVRQAVRFADAMYKLSDEGCQAVVEIGPHPVLAYSINECFQVAGKSIKSVPSLNKKSDDLQCITKSLGMLYSIGIDINWRGFYTQPTRKIDLPRYPFQYRKCWSESYESTKTRLAKIEHPLLGERQELPEIRWQQRIDLGLHGYLKDHQVRGSILYPAAAMLETAVAAVQKISEAQPEHEQLETIRFKNVRFRKPCALAEGRPQVLDTVYEEARRNFIISHREVDQSQWSELARFEHVTCPGETANEFSGRMEALRKRCKESFDGQQLYEYCEKLGLQYSGSFRGVLSGLRCDGEALVEVSMNDELHQASDYLLFPALLDSCFHAMIAADPLFDHTVGGLYLPAEIRDFQFFHRPTGRVVAHAKLLSKSDKLMVCDIEIGTPQGEVVALIKGFESRRVSGTQNAETTKDLIYGYKWHPADEAVSSNSVSLLSDSNESIQDSWCLFMDERGIGRELAERLRAAGHHVDEVFRANSQTPKSDSEHFYQFEPDSKAGALETIRSLVASVPQDRKLVGIVYLWGLDCHPNESTCSDSLTSDATLTCLAPLHLVQALQQVGLADEPKLAFVTELAQSQDGAAEAITVSQTPLVGFGRVVVSEISQLRGAIIDLPKAPKPRDIDLLVAELLGQDAEDEILLRAGKRFVRRFQPVDTLSASKEAESTLPNQLRIGNSAGIEDLRYETKPSLDLKANEVEIEVAATGLNFSDVMKALDLYPGLPDGPVALGAECSGVITRVGCESKWQVGDEVVAVAPGSFGTHCVVNEDLVAYKPGILSHVEAAALPIAFLTADYAINHCARLKAGDSILIHSASGGVGLAAIQIAQAAGIRILATAGTEEKRQFLRQLGIECVMDSRSLDFGEQTLEATGGQGVDAVLNSLAGEAITVGLSTLKVGGRFLEIGKRDIYNDASLGLYPFRNNLALFAIDLDQLFKLQPKFMGERLQTLCGQLENGELQPILTKAFAADDTKAAFKFMQQGKHIGKVIVDYSQRPADVRLGDVSEMHFEGNASYWLAGGLGGFGLELAKWMVGQGAKSLVLSGRSARPSEKAAEVLGQLERQGATITVLPADITKIEDVKRVLSHIDAELPTLRGVFHTAMVLEDKLIADLDRETLNRVLWPKLLGGWNLHEATSNRQLDHFVVFSSLSSVFGHAGQANYSAANAALDGLAYLRRANGLPATVINWGHLGEAGYLAEREQLGKRLERQGVLSFSVQQAMSCLEFALQTKTLQMSVLRMDWGIWRGLGLTNRVSPRFAGLLRESSPDQQGTLNDQASASQLRSVTGIQRKGLIERLLKTKSASLLGVKSEDISSNRALLEMGLDSLMAVEMRNWVESQMLIDLPISALMRSTSLTELIQIIYDLLEESVDGEEFGAEGTTQQTQENLQTIEDNQAEALLSQLPDMEADEINRLLEQVLDGQDLQDNLLGDSESGASE